MEGERGSVDKGGCHSQVKNKLLLHCRRYPTNDKSVFLSPWRDGWGGGRNDRRASRRLTIRKYIYLFSEGEAGIVSHDAPSTISLTRKRRNNR